MISEGSCDTENALKKIQLCNYRNKYISKYIKLENRALTVVVLLLSM